jgi:glucose/mannose-6-phosphate isomerase
LTDLNELKLTDMKSMVEAFPILLKMGELNREFTEEINKRKKEKVSGICIIGMGGSAIAGLYIKYFKQALGSSIPIEIIRDFNIPRFVNKDWVVFAVSYSGNTKETISSLNDALKRGVAVFAFTCGGEMGRILTKRDLPFHTLQKGLQPRAAFPILFSSLVNAVNLLIGEDTIDFEKISRRISSLSIGWDKEKLTSLVRSIPLFIGSGHLIPVAYRAKCQMHENSKMFSVFSELPEADHNQIESLHLFDEKSILPIFLRSSFESEQLQKQINATIKIFQSFGIEVKEMKVQSESEIEEALSMTYFLDYISVQAANLLGVDCNSVPTISKLKELMAEN